MFGLKGILQIAGFCSKLNRLMDFKKQKYIYSELMFEELSSQYISLSDFVQPHTGTSYY